MGPAQRGTSGGLPATTIILPLSLLHNPHDERDLQDELLETRKKLYEIGYDVQTISYPEPSGFFLSAMSARRDPRIIEDSLFLPGEIAP